MIRTTTAVLLAAALLAGAAATASSAHAEGIQTIDCSVDRNRAERTICSSQRLQILDAKITEVYADLMTSRRLSGVAKEHLRQSQYAFLARRDACGSSFSCLDDVMTMRATRIRYFE